MIKCICGLPGNGKNQYATHVAIKAMRDGYKVYSSYPIKTKIRSFNKNNFLKNVEVRTYVINKEKFLKGEYEPGSVIIFDEAWLDFFNMEFKSVNKEEIKKYAGARHMGITLYYLTQNATRITPYLKDSTDSYLWSEKKLLYNKITEYFQLENIGKIVGEEMNQISPKLVKQFIYFRKKSIMTSYNDSYLKDQVKLDGSHDQMYEPFKVEYRSLFKRIRKNITRMLQYRKSLKV